MAELDGIVGMLRRQREQLQEDIRRVETEHLTADEFLDKLRELRERAAALNDQKNNQPDGA